MNDHQACDERSSPCFCDAGDAVAGTVFEEEHQGQGTVKAPTKKYKVTA